ncbi:hypothetical protein RB653_006303 [Dictyostelium firmibasis]|uniref:MYND-type domain-containing protein n=1 Tax=Dictyostelium firmibasis TaxID=79012 RepID=A0AAN7U9H5_9MYCE
MAKLSQQELEKFELFESVLKPVNDPKLKPEQYISSIESSGMPKKEIVMNKYRSSTTYEYIIENSPPPKIFVNNNNSNSNNNNNNYSNSNNNSTITTTTNTSINTKPRSKSCPPAKELPCNNCKRMYPIDLLEACERCGNGCYCSEECQYENWISHRKNCRSVCMVVKMSRNNSF